MSKINSSNRNVVDTLEKLAGARVGGQRLDSLWFHPFSARMPISIVEYLIGCLTTSRSIVLDPMAGSGTTLIAAKRFGRTSMGFDRDPLAFLITRSAVEDFDSRRLEDLRRRILKEAEETAGKIRLAEVRGKLPEEDQNFIRYWFPPQSQKQLFALAASIQKESDNAEQDLAWVVFSSLIVAKSAGASFALDIPHSRPHKCPDKPIVLPFDGWDRRFRAAIARLPFVDKNPSAESRIHLGDARQLPLDSRTVDFILTSPPYRSAIDYLRAHKFSLVWMGYRLEDLRELRGTMVGTERGLWNLDGLPPILEARMHKAIEQDRHRAQLRQYLSDLRKILEEIERVLRPGGLALLVLGPTIINVRHSDAVEITSCIGETVGLRLVGSVVRQLSTVRRSLPPPSAAQRTTLAQRMRREVIVALRK